MLVILKLVIGVFLCVLLNACGEGSRADEGQNPASAAPIAKRNGDTIQFSSESPQLERIRVAEVKVQHVPVDEVVAPGRIEANPSRVSKIALPVAGRIR